MAMKITKAYINGTWHTLTYNSNAGIYEKLITSPTLSSYNQTGGYYPIQVKAEDMAGNVTIIDSVDAVFGSQLRLTVKERIAPAVIITGPGEGAYLTSNTVTISFEITDNDSGVDPDTIMLQVDNLATVTSGITKTAITGGYRCIYSTTLADGRHAIKVNAADNDGNVALQKTIAFTVDTVPPALNVATPSAGLITNKRNCMVTGTTNDVTSPACTVMIKHNDVDQGAVVVNADGSFAKSVNLVKGNNTIYVKSMDRAGKYSEITRVVTYDPDAPVISNVTITPNPVDAGAAFLISVTVTD